MDSQIQDSKKSSVLWSPVPLYNMQLSHLTLFPLQILQWSDEVPDFITDVIPVSFDEKIVLDNFMFTFFAVTFKVYNSTSLFSSSYDGELLQLISKVIAQRQRVHFQQLSGRYVVGLNPDLQEQSTGTQLDLKQDWSSTHRLSKGSNWQALCI